jgi:spore germination protein GerM
MKKRLIIYSGCVVVVCLTLFLLWILGQKSPERALQTVVPNAQMPMVEAVIERDITLYFASSDAKQLVSASGRIGCDSDQSCLREVVEALIRGPGTDGFTVLPANTLLNNVRVEEDLAILDFNSQLVDGHPGGSQSELLTVYALANSVAVNFPHLRQMQITIDGSTVDTLKGHVDLRRPLLADFTYSKRTVDSVDAKEQLNE